MLQGDSEVEGDLNDDEFAEFVSPTSIQLHRFSAIVNGVNRYFKGQAPRTVITTCKRPTKIMCALVR